MACARTSTIFSSLVAAAAIVIPTPGAAQEVEAFQPPEPVAPSDAGAENTVAPPTLWLSLQLAPTFKSDLLEQERGAQLQDANATTAFAVNFTTDRDQDVVFAGSFGARWDSDFENGDLEDELSAFVASAKVNWNRGFRRISPFVSYDFEHSAEGVFGSQVATDHSFAVGADIMLMGSRRCLEGQVPSPIGDGRNICTGTRPYTITVIPSIVRVESNDDTRRRFTPRLEARADFTLENGISFRIAADYQHRIFDQTIDGSRVQDRILASASVDFAGLLQQRRFRIDRLSIGVQWVSVGDVGQPDTSELSLLPIIRLRWQL